DRVQRTARIGPRRSDVAGRDQACGAALRVGSDRRRPRLQRADDRIDLTARVAQPLLELLVEALSERLFAIAQVALASLHLRLCPLDNLPLARNQPPLVIERLRVALDLRQVLGELRLARRALCARLLDDAGRQPEARRDLQRQAAAGRAVMQAI